MTDSNHNKFGKKTHYNSNARRVLIREFRFQHINFHTPSSLTNSGSGLNYTFTPNSANYFPNFPVLIQSDGTPWEISILYLTAKIKECGTYEHRTIRGLADHLLDYLRFHEDLGLNYLYLPENDRLKVTFRYREELIEQISSGKIETSTAKVRINAIANFYREIIKWRLLDSTQLKKLPFEETVKYIHIVSKNGRDSTVIKTSHNLSIRKPKKQRDPECISDGGDLRPLTFSEQETMLVALRKSSREYQLMFYLALFTGARIQTVCTLRLTHLKGSLDQDGNLRLPIGDGTLADTKLGKHMTLLVPGWLVQDMKIYSLSQEAKKRRSRSFYGDNDNNYIFLSKNGIPYYTAKSELIDRSNQEHQTTPTKATKLQNTSIQDGAALRQHIHSILLPRIRVKNPSFQRFTFHDLRASFGMNLLESQLKHSGSGNVTAALEYTQQRMGHSNKETTLQYLNYKSRLEWRSSIQNEFEVSLFRHVNTPQNN